MNNRIFELIQQQNGLGLVWSEEDKKWFAELLVRECVEICKKQEYDYWRSSEDQDFTPQDCADAIEQHFGVE